MSRLNFSNFGGTPISSFISQQQSQQTQQNLTGYNINQSPQFSNPNQINNPINQQASYPNGFAMNQPIQQTNFANAFPSNQQQNFTNYQPQYQPSSETKDSTDIKTILQNTQNQLQKYGDNLVNLQNMMTQMDFKRMYDTILDIPRVMMGQSLMPGRTMRNINLIVSSGDRDLSNTTFNKYNFRVTFGAESNQSSIDYTYRNTSNQGRDISASVVTYKSSGLTNPNLQQVIKNVISVKLRRVVIPRPRYNVFNPEPFFYVCIDELDSNIFATKNFSHKIFSKVVYDEKIRFYAPSDISGREYLYYTNEDDDVAYYYPSPLAKLDRLTIKLVNANGDTLDNQLAFNDTDIVTGTTGNTSTVVSSSTQFFNNTFAKDKLVDVNTGYMTRINDITGTYTYNLSPSLSISTSGHTIVNLSNQIEYVFEVKTVEFDVNSNIQPIL